MRRRAKILVIDDSRVVLQAVKRALEPAGFEVVLRDHPVGSGATIFRERPDIVLLDLNMPALNGLEILKQVRQNGHLKETVVLFHSDQGEEELRRITSESGADGYISKAMPITKLAEELARYLKPSTVLTRVRPLFVDDDELTLRCYRRLFGKLLDAQFVASPHKALEILKSDSPPDVVVSDVVMPELSGMQLLHAAIEIDSSWSRRFLFITGQSVSAELRKEIERANVPLLHKPISPLELPGIIQSLVQATATCRG